MWMKICKEKNVSNCKREIQCIKDSYMKFSISTSNTKERMSSTEFERSKSRDWKSSYIWRKYLKIKYVLKMQQFQQRKCCLLSFYHYCSNQIIVKENFEIFMKTQERIDYLSFHFKRLAHSRRMSMWEIWADIQVKIIKVWMIIFKVYKERIWNPSQAQDMQRSIRVRLTILSV